MEQFAKPEYIQGKPAFRFAGYIIRGASKWHIALAYNMAYDRPEELLTLIKKGPVGMAGKRFSISRDSQGLKESTSRGDFTMTDVTLPLAEMGPSGILLSTVQKYYANLRNIGIEIRDAIRGTEFALNVKNVETNKAGNQVVYFEEETLREHNSDWADRNGFKFGVKLDDTIVQVCETLPKAKHLARQLSHGTEGSYVSVRDMFNDALYFSLSVGE
jgi:hypothetical protein